MLTARQNDGSAGSTATGPAFSDGEASSFTRPHSIPVRHGMTMGELARMYNAERHVGADFRVIAIDPWQHALWLDQTQQSWINPGPNLRGLNAALLYPGIGPLETTNLSVGRGTERPYEWIGAPWLDGPALAAFLNRQAVPGVRFIPVRRRPSSSVFHDEDCSGVEILTVDRLQLRSLRVGLEIACALRRLYPEQSWAAPLEDFKKRRASFLLYP